MFHIDISRHLLPNSVGLPGFPSIPIARHKSCSTVTIDTYRPINAICLEGYRSMRISQLYRFERRTINSLHIYSANGRSFIWVWPVLTCLWLRYNSRYTPLLPPPILFLASRADLQQSRGRQRRGLLLVYARQSGTAGPPSSSTVDIWLCRAFAGVTGRDYCIADTFTQRKRHSLDPRTWRCL